jgi:hypothetical protein
MTTEDPIEQQIKFIPWYVAGAAVLVTGCVVLFRVCGIADTKFFGTADQNAQREVYENTKTYRDGVRRDLDELTLAYSTAKTAEEKQSILSIMKHRVEGIPPELVPADVKQLLESK